MIGALASGFASPALKTNVLDSELLVSEFCQANAVSLLTGYVVWVGLVHNQEIASRPVNEDTNRRGKNLIASAIFDSHHRQFLMRMVH